MWRSLRALMSAGPSGYLRDLRGERETEQVAADPPRGVGVAGARVEAAVGPAADRDEHRHEEQQADRDQRVREPARQIREVHLEVVRDGGDRPVPQDWRQ